MSDIFSKIIRDYNNELESVLEKKAFESDVKNLLLSMLYKIENGYNDYKKVKVNVCSKNQYVREIIDTISQRCNNIEIIKPTSDEGKALHEKGITSIIDKKKGVIKSFQNEKSILDAIIKFKQEDIKLNQEYDLYSDALKDMLLIGNNINSLEVITDFNGWSWDLIRRNEKETVYNFLYQIIIMLIGNKIIDSWVNNHKEEETDDIPSNLILSSKYNENYGITKKEIIGEKKDYVKEIREEFKRLYGDELEEEFFNEYLKIIILEYSKYNKEFEEKIKNRIKYLDKKLKGMSDNKKFIETLSLNKKELTKQIQEIDKLLSSPRALKKEYEIRNEKLPKEEKIFSVSHFKLLVSKERERKLNEIKRINKRMEPKEFVKTKIELENKVEFYDSLNIDDKSEENIEKLIKNLEKVFLKCFETKIKQAKENTEIENLIYELRYFKQLPTLTSRTKTGTTKLEKDIIKKASNQKILTIFSENDSTNYLILKELFISRIIELDTIMISLKYSKGILTMDIFDGNTNDETKQIELTERTEINVKLNKKIRIWQ